MIRRMQKLKKSAQPPINKSGKSTDSNLSKNSKKPENNSGMRSVLENSIGNSNINSLSKEFLDDK